MKKIKILILILALALMLMGVGYAAWNQNSTVTNNVSTGELKVVATDLKFSKLQVGRQNFQGQGTTNNTLILNAMTSRYLNYTLKNNGTDVEINLEKVYPGVTVDYDVTLKNEGTVPVKLNLVDGYKDGNLAKISGMNEQTIALIDKGLLQASISPNYSDEKDGSDPSGLILEVGKSSQYTIEIKVSPELTDAENSTLKCGLKFNFTQATN